MTTVKYSFVKAGCTRLTILKNDLKCEKRGQYMVYTLLHYMNYSTLKTKMKQKIKIKNKIHSLMY